MNPYAVLMAPGLAWKWKEIKMIDDGLAMDTERGADDAKGAYWIPAAGNSNEVTALQSKCLSYTYKFLHMTNIYPTLGV